MKRRFRIAVIDSGVATRHPHLSRPIVDGITITSAAEKSGCEDRLGHGTAICALLQQMAPEADILAVKIFDTRLATSLEIVAKAMEWCLRQRVDLINLSLGTTNRDHLPWFRNLVDRAALMGAVIVSAYKANEGLMLPGSISSVVGVVEDSTCPRECTRINQEPTLHTAACPYPLDIRGVPRERNLQGVSFAVAHVSAHIARIWDAFPQNTRSASDWFTELAVDSSRATHSQLLKQI